MELIRRQLHTTALEQVSLPVPSECYTVKKYFEALGRPVDNDIRISMLRINLQITCQCKYSPTKYVVCGADAHC